MVCKENSSLGHRIRCPSYLSTLLVNWHFSSLKISLLSVAKQASVWCVQGAFCSVLENGALSAGQIIAICRITYANVASMARQNVRGACLSPGGTRRSRCRSWRNLKAFLLMSSSSMSTFQNPPVRNKEKMVDSSNKSINLSIFGLRLEFRWSTTFHFW